jgi:hypothetical protein
MRIRVAFLCALGIAIAAARDIPAQQTAPQFGGTNAMLDARRQHLVDNWVVRFNSVTGQKVEAGPFYDDIIAFSTKTTFEAVTNALMQTAGTDAPVLRRLWLKENGNWRIVADDVEVP